MDLGATVTILSPELCEKLGIEVKLGGLGQQMGGDSVPLDVTSECRVTPEGGPSATGEFVSTDVPLLSLIGAEAVIGIDLLTEGKAIIDVAQRTVTFRHTDPVVHKLDRWNLQTGNRCPEDSEVTRA